MYHYIETKRDLISRELKTIKQLTYTPSQYIDTLTNSEQDYVPELLIELAKNNSKIHEIKTIHQIGEHVQVTLHLTHTLQHLDPDQYTPIELFNKTLPYSKISNKPPRYQMKYELYKFYYNTFLK